MHLWRLKNRQKNINFIQPRPFIRNSYRLAIFVLILFDEYNIIKTKKVRCTLLSLKQLHGQNMQSSSRYSNIAIDTARKNAWCSKSQNSNLVTFRGYLNSASIDSILPRHLSTVSKFCVGKFDFYLDAFSRVSQYCLGYLI